MVSASASADTWPMSESDWSSGGSYGNWSVKYAWSDQWSDGHWSGGYHDAIWDAGRQGWDASWNGAANGTQYVWRGAVGLWYDATDALLAWTAPADGEYTVTASALLVLADYDGAARSMELSIQKNYDAFVADRTSYSVTREASTVSVYSGSVTLSAGDTLYFRTRNQSNSSYEEAAWAIAVVPEPMTLGLLTLGGLFLARRK
jgi:hypothetical protein